MTRYLLIPAEGVKSNAKEIELPKGLLHDGYEELFDRVSDVDVLRKLLFKLAEADISFGKSGNVKHKNGELDEIDFKEAVVDSCNGKFKHCYEPFYCLLRSYGISF